MNSLDKLQEIIDKMEVSLQTMLLYLPDDLPDIKSLSARSCFTLRELCSEYTHINGGITQ